MIKYLLLSVFAICMLTAGAQEKAPVAPAVTSSWRFQANASLGVISGASRTSFQPYAVVGARYKQLSLGIGSALDYYLYKGVPVFLDTRFYTSSQPSSFFLYGDAGIHFPTSHNSHSTNIDTIYRRGFYSDIGVGYAFECGGHKAVEISAGWTYKRVINQSSAWVVPFVGPPYKDVRTYNYDLTRIVFRMGFRF